MRPIRHIYRPAVIAAGILSALVSLPARAVLPGPQLTEIKQVRCICAMDYRNHGDYVQCVAHMTERMVVTSVISQDERREEVVTAAHMTDDEIVQLQADCANYAPEGCGNDPDPETRRWGVMVDIDRAYYDQGESIDALTKLWNFTGRDIYMWSNQGTPHCRVRFEIHDRMGNRVSPELSCTDVVNPAHVRDGEVLEWTDTVPLVGEGGVPLLAGYYTLTAHWVRNGPYNDPFWETENCLVGTQPLATIPFQIIIRGDECSCLNPQEETANPLIGLNNCHDGLDNDCDGLLDCCDPGCDVVFSGCQFAERGHCEDGIDNDCNGSTDCVDPACISDPACW